VTAFELLVAAASAIGGIVATLAGFGIGSVITPLLAARLGMKVAVAAVAIPHVIGTALRFWFLRKSIDRRVMLSFGVTSALGGLAGALLHAFFTSRALALLLAALLIFAGVTGLLGITLRFGRRGAWIAGALSGMLGGLVGNQGGIRAGAMLGFDVPKEAFIATSTAVALFVDGMRVPVYLATQGRELLAIWPLVLVATIGVVLGTFAGRAILGRLSEETFKRVVSVLLIALGVSMLFIA
jgi:uncharacterized membrane protein YfcA